MKILIKLDKFFAWVLFAGMLLYFISGYGMTKGLIDATFATKLHLNLLTYIILIAFTVHTAYAIHLALKRWQAWNLLAKILLFLFFAIFIGFFVYVDRYYQSKAVVSSESNQNIGDDKNDDEDNDSVAITNQNVNSSNTNTTTTAKTFTLSELAKFNGQNGNSAYVAVDSNVYDLTSIFGNGKHYSHFAGKELTNAFYSYHAKTALAKYPIVGTLVK